VPGKVFKEQLSQDKPPNSDKSGAAKSSATPRPSRPPRAPRADAKTTDPKNAHRRRQA